MTSETPCLSSSLLDSALAFDDTSKRIRWYMSVIVNLASLNYPDVIPQVWEHFSSNVLQNLPQNERFAAVQKIREGLIKSAGIIGAARSGNAIRRLSLCIPEDYRETESPRSKESEDVAIKRGRAFWKNIYSRNEAFDPEASVRASPDYAFVVRDVLYARIFSYDGVLDPLTTGYAIVSGLYGMDCPNQIQSHLKGMLWNGASTEDLVELRELCLRVAKELGVQFRFQPGPIPKIPNQE